MHIQNYIKYFKNFNISERGYSKIKLLKYLRKLYYNRLYKSKFIIILIFNK